MHAVRDATTRCEHYCVSLVAVYTANAYFIRISDSCGNRCQPTAARSSRCRCGSMPVTQTHDVMQKNSMAIVRADLNAKLPGWRKYPSIAHKNNCSNALSSAPRGSHIDDTRRTWRPVDKLFTRRFPASERNFPPTQWTSISLASIPHRQNLPHTESETTGFVRRIFHRDRRTRAWRDIHASHNGIWRRLEDFARHHWAQVEATTARRCAWRYRARRQTMSVNRKRRTAAASLTSRMGLRRHTAAGSLTHGRR